MSLLTVRHPLLIGFSDYLTRAGRWRQWVSADQRLAGFDSLDSILEGWRGGDRSEDLYQAVSAAAALGSRRGADDSDAAVALLVLLQDGIVARGTKLAVGSQRHRPADEVIDGVLLALWEQVRMSAPNLGCRGPAFLLARACRQAIRDAKPVAAALVAAEAMAWGTPFAAFARGAARKPCGRGGGARGLSAVIDDLVARTASRSPELPELLFGSGRSTPYGGWSLTITAARRMLTSFGVSQRRVRACLCWGMSPARIRPVGGAPGCLVMILISVVLSVLLTIVLNVLR